VSDIEENESELQALFDKTAAQPSEVQWAAMARKSAGVPRRGRSAGTLAIAIAAFVVPALVVCVLLVRQEHASVHAREMRSIAPQKTVWADAEAAPSVSDAPEAVASDDTQPSDDDVDDSDDDIRALEID
jgi:hypothetical protein